VEKIEPGMTQLDKREIAILFGQSLDNDEFNRTKNLLSHKCKYFIGNDVLIGPDNICHSYKQNMIEGRKKLDALEWGQSTVESVNDSEYYIHFIDYLTHKGKSYIHKCKQLILINDKGKIISIKHIHDKEEQERLDLYYKEVGLKE
jgi:hypothetical protein